VAAVLVEKQWLNDRSYLLKNDIVARKTIFLLCVGSHRGVSPRMADQ
jgi:hypothetical protein